MLEFFLLNPLTMFLLEPDAGKEQVPTLKEQEAVVRLRKKIRHCKCNCKCE